MALENEKNTNLAFDTETLKDCAEKYGDIAKELREMAKKLDNCLSELVKSGWTTPAGEQFYKLTETNWNENIEKYAALLETLEKILKEAARDYDNLSAGHIEKTVLK